MIFYDCATAPSPRRARIWLAEKQAPHSVVEVDLRKAEQLGADFKKINPACTVPALQLDDGTIITQNAGIAAYLEAQFPEPPLLGSTAIEKGLIADWVAKIEFEGLQAVAEALRNSAPALQGRALTGPENYAQIPELAARGLTRLQAFVDRLDAHLGGRDFIAAERFSNADIVAAVTIDFAKIVKVKPQDSQRNLLRWRAGLATRPSFSL